MRLIVYIGTYVGAANAFVIFLFNSFTFKAVLQHQQQQYRDLTRLLTRVVVFAAREQLYQRALQFIELLAILKLETQSTYDSRSIGSVIFGGIIKGNSAILRSKELYRAGSLVNLFICSKVLGSEYFSPLLPKQSRLYNCSRRELKERTTARQFPFSGRTSTIYTIVQLLYRHVYQQRRISKIVAKQLSARLR